MTGDLTRDEIKNVVRKVVHEAEVLAIPESAYAWHRRVLLGIDFSIEAAQKRSADTRWTRLPGLQRSAEMTLYWMRALQARTEAEHEACMGVARGLYEGLAS